SKSGLLLEAGFVQTAENAREIAVRNIDEEDAETARRAGLDREASSKNRADEESRRRLHAEATTADAVRQRNDANQQTLDAQATAQQATDAQANAERDRNNARQLQLVAEADSDRNRAAASASDTQLQRAV